jgi:hypothetical protein
MKGTFLLVPFSTVCMAPATDVPIKNIYQWTQLRSRLCDFEMLSINNLLRGSCLQ